MKNLMPHFFRLLVKFAFVLFVVISFTACSEQKELVDYVDPFIGTDKEGNTFPGACLPFGMVQLSPDNGFQGVKAYNYSKTSILGFSHTHLSGTGSGTKTNYNNILIMPTIGDLKVFPGIAKDPDRMARNRLEDKLDNISDKEQQKFERMSREERRK